MNLIDQLEERVDHLLTEVARLREENRRLAQESESGRAALVEENQRLTEELTREQAAKSVVLARIDGLLHKLKAANSEG